MNFYSHIVFLLILLLSGIVFTQEIPVFVTAKQPVFDQEDIGHTNIKNIELPIIQSLKSERRKETGLAGINYMKRDLKDQFNVTDITDEIQNNKVDYELQDERHVKNAMLELSNDELSDGNIKANKEGGGNIPFLQGTGNEPNVDSGNIPLLPGGSIPQLPTGGNTDGNKEGSIPFLPGGNLPQFPGGLINSVGQGMSQTPKLVWGGFFFVETPMPGASLSNIANMASLMQGGQQMIPGGGLPTQMIPIPGAG